MKLDRKEILKALETITIAGRKKYGGSGAVTNVVTLRLLLIGFAYADAHQEKSRRRH
jgi:hypothetical protein